MRLVHIMFTYYKMYEYMRNISSITIYHNKSETSLNNPHYIHITQYVKSTTNKTCAFRHHQSRLISHHRFVWEWNAFGFLSARLSCEHLVSIMSLLWSSRHTVNHIVPWFIVQYTKFALPQSAHSKSQGSTSGFWSALRSGRSPFGSDFIYPLSWASCMRRAKNNKRHSRGTP